MVWTKKRQELGPQQWKKKFRKTYNNSLQTIHFAPMIASNIMIYCKVSHHFINMKIGN